MRTAWIFAGPGLCAASILAGLGLSLVGDGWHDPMGNMLVALPLLVTLARVRWGKKGLILSAGPRTPT